MNLSCLAYVLVALLMLMPVRAADEKPLFPGKIVAVITGDQGYGMAMENVTVVEIAGSRYLRGSAVKTVDARYWYRGKEVLVPEKAITAIVLFDDLEDYQEALEKADKAFGAGLPGAKGKEVER
jgi:hypothetical protein